ncbi:hypothetical protein CBR_g46205 [Chara braunii]|uniref:Uncharacterized protein n=1 Tax=Chara braunii TaxID=69332 RepID=A0A388M028_CHABU|nr:hypothetical protein CBR_g46205 [Chara braunii]|eukprot:GBG87906.1 hypothetical protein CBR_g46205 [Chara braunii]
MSDFPLPSTRGLKSSSDRSHACDATCQVDLNAVVRVWEDVAESPNWGGEGSVFSGHGAFELDGVVTPLALCYDEAFGRLDAGEGGGLCWRCLRVAEALELCERVGMTPPEGEYDDFLLQFFVRWRPSSQNWAHILWHVSDKQPKPLFGLMEDWANYLFNGWLREDYNAVDHAHLIIESCRLANVDSQEKLLEFWQKVRNVFMEEEAEAEEGELLAVVTHRWGVERTARFIRQEIDSMIARCGRCRCYEDEGPEDSSAAVWASLADHRDWTYHDRLTFFRIVGHGFRDLSWLREVGKQLKIDAVTVEQILMVLSDLFTGLQRDRL